MVRWIDGLPRNRRRVYGTAEAVQDKRNVILLTKRCIIAILGGINLLLAAALILASQPAPSAFAQRGARAGNFVSVTAKASGQSYDVLYVLDVPGQKLHGYYPAGGRGGNLIATPPRDLAQDFGRD